MPILLKLDKRAYYGSWGDDNNGARWGFFALFIILVIIFLLYTFRINRRRIRRGAKPVRGTAWLTPPSYHQSQTQYNSAEPNAVPPYSADAMPNDAGFYDQYGNFHVNPNAQKPGVPQQGGVVSDVTGVSAPAPSHTNGTDTSPEMEMNQFTRPSYPPPSSGNIDSGEGSSSSHDNTPPDYRPPLHPPPSARKN